ncbi:hypothetical protein BT102_12990 [Lacticaseibacillus rhamnosus]|uniref:Uncharacterized protein n=1 Tax=Lacticaseibacillus rhamnosus TaxID=47715 RepID=A0AAP8LX75_LACRH|nr:hypothetical protein BT102_12990 [Lacticaseibacillus rhamnosus]PLA58757.1 hypothetical protein CYJ91_04345 [Lacticaseibacillus rhamnosus]PTM22911.1 hypothetical protein DA801_12315 [Lacticaseibacillus rhamnosus]TXK07926.1 hypothetical protein FU656_01410 [Lacticaseibacillus rhamnosus]
MYRLMYRRFIKLLSFDDLQKENQQRLIHTRWVQKRYPKNVPQFHQIPSETIEKVQTKKPAKSAFSANRSGLNGTKTLSGGTS